MRTRRIIAAVLIGALALGVLAFFAPWPDLSDRITGSVARQLRTAYGIELAVGGPGTVAVLPAPAIRFRRAELKDQNGAAWLASEALRIEFRILPLLLGRVEVAGIDVAGARISIDLDADEDSSWKSALRKVRERVAARSVAGVHVTRIRLVDGEVIFRRAGAEIGHRLLDATAAMDWPAADAPVTLSGQGRWHGDTVQWRNSDIRPAELAAGRPSPFELEVTWAGGRIRARGEAALREGLEATGNLRFEARSLGEFLDWTGGRLALGPLVGGLLLEGDFTADRERASWPALQLTIGSDRLDGAASAKLSDHGVAVTATLAADSLALTPLLEPLTRALGPGGWSADPIDLATLTGGDLDLRLSANSARFGPVRLSDLAASLMVSPGRIEATVARAGLNRGRVKGRLSLAAVPDAVEAKALGSYERVDVGALLVDLGYGRWIAGAGQGQVAFEAVGPSMAVLAQRATGRASVAVRSGDLTGISLYQVLRYGERGGPVPANIRGGRTPFDHAQVTLQISEGQGEFTEGTLTAPTLKGGLQGRISLPDRTLSATARVEGVGLPDAPPLVVFEINGPWDHLAVAPEPRSEQSEAGPPETEPAHTQSLSGPPRSGPPTR